MRTFAQKQNQPQKPLSSSLARPNIATAGPGHREHPILQLQRAIGNQAVQRMLRTNAEELKAGLTAAASPRFGHDFSRIPPHPPIAGAIHTKLVINEPGDEYEQEADSISEQVMRMPELTPIGSAPAAIQGKCAAGEDEKDEAVPVERAPWSAGSGASFEFGRIRIHPEQGRPVELDPNDPLAESGLPPDAGVPKAVPPDAAKKEKKCCGCIEDIKIQNVKKINADRSYGHSFDTVWSLSYVETEGAGNDLTLEWLEKTNRGYTEGMRAKNNVWYDMTKDPETSSSFDDSWGSRTKPCPGKETITDTDPPTASLDLPARTLEFKITVKSGAGCKCKNASKTLTAKQVLEPTSDTPPKVKTQNFTTP